MPAAPLLTDTNVRIVAAVAELDERTVRAALERRPPSAAVRAAILAALRAQSLNAVADRLERRWTP